MPKGVVSVLPGKGSVIGDAIVRHPLVKKVSFTGGTEAGRGIARIAADKLMPVSLELGGKSPTIVFDDADLDHAVNGVLYGIFSSSGEACIAGSRLFVAALDLRRSSSTAARRRRAQAARRRSGGRENTQMGPLITAKHRETDRALRRSSASKRAAACCAGGERPVGDGREAGTTSSRPSSKA